MSETRSPSITHHAVERFKERCRPDLSLEDAKRLLLWYTQTEQLQDDPPWPKAFYNGACGWLPCGLGAVGVAVPHKKWGHPVIVTVLSHPTFRVRHD